LLDTLATKHTQSHNKNCILLNLISSRDAYLVANTVKSKSNVAELYSRAKIDSWSLTDIAAEGLTSNQLHQFLKTSLE